jgi:hypothetical protein
MDLLALCKRFAMLKAQKEAHEKSAEILGSALFELGQQVNDALLNAGVPSQPLDGKFFADGRGRIIRPEMKYKPSIKNEAMMFAWVRKEGLDVMIKETIHPKTLESFVKKQKEANKPLPPEEALAVFTVNTATVTRAPNK